MRILAVVFVSLIGWLSSPEQPAVQYATLLPAMTFSGHNPRAGIAWCYGCMGQYAGDMATYRAYWHYGTGWQNALSGYLASGGIPIVRGDLVERAEILAAYGYTGSVLWANEPDRPNQDDFTPANAAATFRLMERTCPDCQWVIPNISQLGLDWLRQFKVEYELAFNEPPQPAAWSFHYYGDATGFLATLGEFCEIVGDCTDVWLTEFGTCQEGQAAAFYEQVVTRPELARFGYYTNRNSNPAGSCSELVNTSGNETPIGAIWRETITTAR